MQLHLRAAVHLQVEMHLHAESFMVMTDYKPHLFKSWITVRREYEEQKRVLSHELHDAFAVLYQHQVLTLCS